MREQRGFLENDYFWPQDMSQLYLDSATLIWNGNGVMGSDKIHEFWMKLPSSTHTILSYDAQPMQGIYP